MKSSLVTSKQTVEVIDHSKTGNGLRAARKSVGLSLRTLSAEMEFTAPYLSDLENGRRNWTAGLVNKYNTALTNFKIRALQAALKAPLPPAELKRKIR